jgi:DNA-binding transcriptional ArsR family regulator
LAEEATAPRKPPGERKREIGDAVAYALGNAIRNVALAVLAEGKRSKSELAKITGIDLRTMSHHVDELYECGCIEDAGSVKKGNVTERFYRTVILPYITDEAYRNMTPEERRDVNGVTVQSILTETLASFRAGKMEPDEQLWLLWDALNLDVRGKEEVAEELAESYERIQAIHGRATNRLCESGETGTMSIVTLTSFERGRNKHPAQSYAPPS